MSIMAGLALLLAELIESFDGESVARIERFIMRFEIVIKWRADATNRKANKEERPVAAGSVNIR